MADISKEIKDFQDAVYGEEVRGSMISLANKLNKEASHAEETATKMDKELSEVDQAEHDRAEAEQKRATAEQERVRAESDRSSAESERADAEQSRAEAETARVKAEEKRDSAEQERAQAESERASAESERAKAETTRDDAEKERAQAEAARKKAEEDRVSAEQERVRVEGERVTAEDARAKAEEARAEAEKKRVQAEDNRAQAEGERASAESGRTDAEAERERKTEEALTGIVTASQTLQQQIEKADENIEILQNLNLEGDIAEAAQAAKDLQNIVAEAEPKAQEIEGIIDTADSLKSALDADITAGAALKQQLDGSVEGAQGVVQAATEAAQAANKAASDIQQKAEAGDFTAKITGVEVEMVDAEKPASVENTGTEQAASFHFKLPKGPKGEGFTGGELRDGHLYLTKDDGTEVDAGAFDITKEIIEAALGYTPEAKITKQEATLDPGAWTGKEFPYLYEIAVKELTDGQGVFAYNAEGLSEDEIAAFMDACITAHHLESGKAVLQATAIPEIELPVVLEIGGAAGAFATSFPGGGGGGGGTSIPLGNCTGIKTLKGDKKVKIKWSDPPDTYLSDVPVTTWTGTRLMRKEGSYPTDERDGTLVTDNLTRDQYKDTWFEDTSVKNGTKYFYKLFPYSKRLFTNSDANQFTVTPAPIPLAEVTAVSATAGDAKVTLAWTDPADISETSDTDAAVWAGTKVVRKIGGAPTGPDDGTEVVNEKTRDQYKTSGYVDSGLDNGTAYYYGIYPYTKAGTYSAGYQTSATPSLAPPKPCTDLAAKAGNASATLTWTDPKASEEISGQLVTWAGTKLVRKEGSAPTAWTDGKLVKDSQVHDQYKTEGYTDTGLKNGTEYFYAVFAYSTDGAYSTGISVSVTPVSVRVYGVQWDGTPTTKWNRTDDAAEFGDPTPAVNSAGGSSPFDDRMPWSGMTVSSRNGGKMVAIPKFWYKLEKNGNGMTIQIADAEKEGFVVSPAHMDRGDGKERDFIYVGAYHSAEGTYKSETGKAQLCNVTRDDAKKNLQSVAANHYMMDFATRFTLWLLYLVEFADWNSQDTIGQGCSADGQKENNGKTDGISYHTGTTAADRKTYGYTKYRNIEGLWDNVYDWLAGCYNNASGLNIILDLTKDSNDSGGKCVGLPKGGYPSAYDVNDKVGFPMFYPTEANGSGTTYACDYWGFSASDPCVCAGGYYYKSTDRGLFYLGYNGASNSSSSIGARLLELP